MSKREYRELKLRIHAKINGQEVTPLTLPMAKFAEYLADFASLLGHRDYVHFRELKDGSATSVALVEMEKDAPVRERVKQAANGTGPDDARKAYAQLNARLTKDNGYGEILETIGTREAKIVEFPGAKRQLSPIYGPIQESSFVQGELKRVGGQEPTIPIHLQDADGNQYYCWATKPVATQLAPFIFQQVRLMGIATWQRDENATWRMLDFEVQSYIAPLTTDSVSSILSELRAVPGSEWNKFEDPLAELRHIRHGEDSQ